MRSDMTPVGGNQPPRRDATLPALAQAEQERRLEAYRVDERALELLATMNELLAAGTAVPPPPVARPNVFVFGLPRSGTTLLYQLLAHSLDLGYVDNVAARFWRAPVFGIALSRAVLAGRRDDSFRSDYGKSLSPGGPHEFGYFWQGWLGVHDQDDAARYGGEWGHVDWCGLRDELRRMQDVLQRGLVHKTNYAANAMAGFARHLDMPLFVHVRRPRADVALSILRARRDYYGDSSMWWATPPPSYPSIRALPVAQQIARQVADLESAYDAAMASVSSDRVLCLDYRQVCAGPVSVLDLVRERIAALYDRTVAVVHAPPAEFRCREGLSAADPEEAAVLAAVAEL